MGTAIDMDYCMIVIEKLINPMTPPAQVMPLLRDLMDSVSHPDMKKLAERIVDPELGLGEKRALMEDFRNFDHGGANSFKDVDYTVLIDKFIDPNLPDHEYKPTMKALLDGDLDQEKKNMIIDIINTPKTEREKIANKVKRFKSFFDREREEKERAERERKEAKAKREKEKAELEANLLVFTDDGMTLIMKMIDKKIPAEKRTQLYDRIMEPDIPGDIKNLAIQLLSTKKSEYLNVVENFKKEREEARLAEIKRKEDAAKKKLEEEQAMKDSKMKRKQELLANKNKSERMKKRELMLKYRAAERAQGRGGAGGGEGYVGPGSVQEREEWRRKERQKVAEEIRRFREKAKIDMLRQEREDRRKEGWTVTPMDLSYNVSVNVVVPDLMTILSDEQKSLFEKAVAAVKAGVEVKPTIKENSESKKTDPAVTKEPPPPAEEEDDEEFKEYFKIFSNPDLSEKDEVSHIKKLIADKKSALVRKLVIKLATVEGVGKSTIFKTLAKKFVKDPPPKPAEEKKVDAVDSDPPKPADATHSGDNNSADKVESSVKTSATSNGIVQNGIEGTADESRKRHVSSESTKSNVSSKNSEHSRKRHVSNESTKSNVSSKSKERRVDDGQTQDKSRRPSTDSSKSNESSQLKVKNGLEENKENKSENKEDTEHNSADKKKKKKHKHKDDEDKDKEGSEKKHKKHKHKEKHKHKDKHKKKDKSKSPERIEKKRDSVDSTVSNSSSKSERGLEEKSSKPIDDMSLKEIKAMFNLQSIDAYVKVKNCKKLYRQINEALEARQNTSDESGKRSRSSSCESSSRKRQRKGSTSQPPSRPTSAQSIKSSSSRKSRAPSRSLSRSRSRSDSRSPVRYVSRTPSRSVSRSPVRSPSPMSS